MNSERPTDHPSEEPPPAIQQASEIPQDVPERYEVDREGNMIVTIGRFDMGQRK